VAIRRGDIYFVDLNPTHGREQSGRRPVLVLSIDAINRLPLVVTVVVGTKGENRVGKRDACARLGRPAGTKGRTSDRRGGSPRIRW
jgi:mRNA-degrading endonuclease toxin of MazEF toxin-antitoxin module